MHDLRPDFPSVGRDGVLASRTVTILIPALDPGTHTVKAQVGDDQGATVSVAFTITDEDFVAAADSHCRHRPPRDAFAALIDSGNLLTVYSFDEENQVYLSYDPDPANAGFNNLDTVSSGDILLGPADRRGPDLPWQDPVRRVGPGGTTLKQSQTP